MSARPESLTIVTDVIGTVPAASAETAGDNPATTTVAETTESNARRATM